MSVWFDGSQQIDCSIEDVKRALADPGDLFAGVVRHMPGMTSVDVLEKSADSVTIQTNEGHPGCGRGVSGWHNSLGHCALPR